MIYVITKKIGIEFELKLELILLNVHSKFKTRNIDHFFFKKTFRHKRWFPTICVLYNLCYRKVLIQ